MVMRALRAVVLCGALALAVSPATAFADDDALQFAPADWNPAAAAADGGSSATVKSGTPAANLFAQCLACFSEGTAAVAETAAAAMPAQQPASAKQSTSAQRPQENKLLAYDPAHIEAIGSQDKSGHTICCPSYACAYADAVLDGTVHDHEYYTCSCCSWTDWGGGDSSFRDVGTDEQLLREAYDQISAGKPTVIHVTWSGGEHWIALIGYENAADPDHLSLSNFIALDPWDGAQLNAGSKYELFGDGCEHISER